MSSPSTFKTEQSPASIYASEPQTPADDGVISAAVAQLSMNDEHSLKVKTTEAGSYSMGTKSPAKSLSPSTERYSPPFVRQGLATQKEDPFKVTSPSTRRHVGSATPTPSKAVREANINAILSKDDWRSGSSNGSDDGDSVVFSTSLQRVENRDATRKLSFGVEPRDIKPDDAQSIYPPSCCVFVANLLQSEGEETLQMAVTQVFREFGPVFVKIRRDAKQMPFAFCQFTKPEHAERAIQEGRGRLIKGRPCRCEKAKAHRSLFFVERKFGPTANADEVRQLLEPYGHLDFCYLASAVERAALNLNEGVLVQFSLYDDGQNAQSAFRNNDVWKLVAVAGMNSPGRIMGPNLRDSLTETDTARAYLSRYETDRRSIFVGNLPLGTTDRQIKDLFESFGKIDEIILRENASKFDSHEKFCFAFVQFEGVMAVSNILAVGHFSLGGRTLRISQKNSETPKHASRPVTSTPLTTTAFQSPAHGQVQQPISPVSMAPPVYGGSPYSGSPYGGYPYASPYYYPGAVYSDGYNYYQPAAYPAPYQYPSSPAFNDPTSSGTAQVVGSPTTTSYYGAYSSIPGYPWSPAPYWGGGMTGPQQSPATLSSSPAYYPLVAASTATDNRSATPTPAGHGAAPPENSSES